jgi:hypothetical protein
MSDVTPGTSALIQDEQSDNEYYEGVTQEEEDQMDEIVSGSPVEEVDPGTIAESPGTIAESPGSAPS